MMLIVFKRYLNLCCFLFNYQRINMFSTAQKNIPLLIINILPFKLTDVMIEILLMELKQM
jgi:hypothetical protein